MRLRLIVGLVLLAIVGVATYLFAVQNAPRTTQLSFDLGFVAWQLANPVSIPALMAICFGTGVALGAGLFLIRVLGLGSEVRTLRGRTDTGADPWSS